MTSISPDVLERARALALRCVDDFEFFALTCLKIRTKSGEIVPFRLNRAQRTLHAKLEAQRAKTGRVRAICLKARQTGISTYIQARYYWRLWGSRLALRAFILTHEDAATSNLFSMAQRFQDLMPPHMRPKTKAANAKELIFAANDCGYQVATAGSREVGRSATIQLLHACLGSNTPVIDGVTGKLRPIKEIEPGDSVLTHTGKIAAVSFVSAQIKPVRNIKLRGLNDFPLEATDDHRFWTPTGWQRLCDLKVDDEIGFPVRRIKTELTEWSFKAPELIRPQGGGTWEDVPDTIPLNYDVGRVVGLYLAEGCLKYQSTSFKRTSAISLAVHQKEVARTLEWLEPLRPWIKSIAYKNRANQLGAVVSVYGTSFAMFLERFVGKTDGKRFPFEWWLMGEEFVRGLVHGYLSGDGHSSPKRDRRIVLTSIRSATVMGLRDAAASLGYGWAAVTYTPEGIRYGRYGHEAWTFSLSGEGVNRLAKELGKDCPPRKRVSGNVKSLRVADGFAWSRIVSISDEHLTVVRDLEIDHPDHSYCILHGASHNSEAAFWPNAEEHVVSLLTTALSRAPGTEAIIESTGNGIGNVFYRLAMEAVRGNSEYEAIFIPWFWDDEYREPCPASFEKTISEEWQDYGAHLELEWDQVYWAYLKNKTLAQSMSLDPDLICAKFKQEFSSSVDDCFQTTGDSFIPGHRVLAARRPPEQIIGRGPIILGIDPARDRDKVGIVDRCGRRLGQRICEAWEPEGDTVYLAQRIAAVIHRINPDMINMDIGSNGAGVFDQLVSMGYGDKLNAINFGSAPLGKGPTGDRMYLNRRAEMHDLMRDWFETPGGVQIPDSDSLHADLTAAVWGPTATRYNTANALVIEEKEKIKERLGHSTDINDGCILTFGIPYAENMVSQHSAPRERKTRSRRGGY